MSCFISSGYTLDCRTSSVGGLKTIWILGGAGNNISGFTENANREITSVSGAGTFFKFELTKQGSSFTENITVNTTAQSVVFEPTLLINLPKFSQTLRNTFQDLVALNNVFAVVEDNNGRYWSFSFTNGGLVTAGGVQTGLAYSDLNGMAALTIVGGEPNASQELVVVNNDLQAVFVGITVEL